MKFYKEGIAAAQVKPRANAALATVVTMCDHAGERLKQGLLQIIFVIKSYVHN